MTGQHMLAVDEARELEPGLEASTDLGAVLAGAEVVVTLNSEQIYADIERSTVGIGGTADRPTYVIDTRGILDTNALEANGIAFDVLGSIGQ